VSKVYFVGCGPGDPDLITVKAKKLIQKADVVVYSGSLIPSEILKMCKKAKRYDAAKLVREEIFDLLKKNARKGKRVVRLHDGDPSIYGAIREQMDNLYKEKIDSIAKSTKLSTKTVARTIEKFEANPAIQFTIIYDPRKLEKFIAFALLAMVQTNIKKIKKEIETSFGDNFWQVPFTAKELLVLFMYSDNIYNADTMRHKIKQIDGVAFTEVFFPKKITMPTNWIINSIKDAARSERLHVPIKQINR